MTLLFNMLWANFGLSPIDSLLSEIPITLYFRSSSGMISPKDTAASRRPLKIYARICGTMNTAGAIKEGAEAMIAHCFIHQYHGNASVESKLKLKWRVFTDFSNLPHQHTDVFLIYCRTAVLEFAVLTPPKNFLRIEYPFACRYDNQFFGCVSIKDVSSKYELAADESSRFLNEISCFNTIAATFGAEIDAANYARTTARPPPEGGYLCILPMYDWLLVSDRTFEKYDIALTSSALQEQNPDLFLTRTGSQKVLQQGLSGSLGIFDDDNDDRTTSTASTYNPQSPRKQYQQYLQQQSHSQLQKSLNLSGTINTHNNNFNQSDKSFNITDTSGRIYNLDDRNDGDMVEEKIEGFDTLPPIHDAAKTLNRTLSEFGIRPTSDPAIKSKGIGLLSHSRSLSALNSNAQFKNIAKNVEKKARESGKLYHSHHMHNREHQQRKELAERKVYLAQLDQEKRGSSNNNNSGNTEEKGPDLAALAKESLRHLKVEKAKAEDKAAALSGVIAARMNVLHLNHELLNIESLIAQERNERFEKKEKAHWIQLGVKEIPSIATNNNTSNEDSDNDNDDGDDEGGRGGHVDKDAVPRGLRFAIKSNSDAASKRVDRAVADKRVQLAEAIVNLPSTDVLRKEIKQKREKEEQKQYTKAKLLAKKLEELQHHPLHHHHHSTKHDHHSGDTPRIDQMQSMLMESATNHALNSPGGDSTSSGTSSTSSSSSVSTEHQDETGQRLYLSYTKPDVHHHHHHVHKFTLKEKIIALDDMMTDNSNNNELFRTIRSVRN